MAGYEELKRLNMEKERIFQCEKSLIEARKQSIARLAEKYGITALPDDDIRLEFEKIVSKYQHNK